MSISVPLERLAGEIEGFGGRGYLITVADDGRPHAVSVSVAWDGEELVLAVGAGTARNAGQRRLVSLLFPPGDARGYSLIVDGQANVTAAGVGTVVRVRPTGAVLHRPAGPTSPVRNAGALGAPGPSA